MRVPSAVLGVHPGLPGSPSWELEISVHLPAGSYGGPRPSVISTARQQVPVQERQPQLEESRRKSTSLSSISLPTNLLSPSLCKPLPNRHPNDHLHGESRVLLTHRLICPQGFAADGRDALVADPAGPGGLLPCSG